MSEDNELYLSEEAVLSLVSTLAMEIVRYGEAEAQLIENSKLSESEVIVVMKANTLLTFSAMLLVKIVETGDAELAKMVVALWTSPAMQDMVQIAFTEEIDEAVGVIAQGIADLEEELNKEKNDPGSQQGD
jgi:hypothetical protein